MPFLKTIFNATDKVLDLTSLAVHGGMLVNGLARLRNEANDTA